MAEHGQPGGLAARKTRSETPISVQNLDDDPDEALKGMNGLNRMKTERNEWLEMGTRLS